MTNNTDSKEVFSIKPDTIAHIAFRGIRFQAEIISVETNSSVVRIRLTDATRALLKSNNIPFISQNIDHCETINVHSNWIEYTTDVLPVQNEQQTSIIGYEQNKNWGLF